MKKVLLILVILALLAPMAAWADNIEGIYDCEGKNPGGAGAYKGTLSIIKNEDTYNVTWTIAGSTYLGVGILDGNTFSVGYTDSGKTWYGVVVYKVDGPKLVGTWAMAGNGKTGTETLNKRK
jgi:hypothetical protein